MKDVIQAFDMHLAALSLSFEAVVIGGGALIVMDVTNRKTKDIDCLEPDIPEEIRKASIDFARVRLDLSLGEHWLNNGPVTSKHDLPADWRTRLIVIYEGEALTLQTLGRPDFLKSKLFAYCDRLEPDREELLRLKPSISELDDAIEWVKARDGNSMWPDHVETAFKVPKKELGYEP